MNTQAPKKTLEELHAESERLNAQCKHDTLSFWMLLAGLFLMFYFPVFGVLFIIAGLIPMEKK